MPSLRFRASAPSSAHAPQRTSRLKVWPALLLLALLPAAAQAAGRVEVAWIEPASYRDAGPTPWERERVLQALDAHLGLWSRALPDGQTLRLEVTDLDLAGEIRPFAWHDTRVLRSGADWPQMSLRYTLQADGRTLKSGEARLSDMGYQFARRSETLGYEKAMIDRWFRQEFSAP
jgi:Protein of unknown function (DUF3016)